MKRERHARRQDSGHGSSHHPSRHNSADVDRHGVISDADAANANEDPITDELSLDPESEASDSSVESEDDHGILAGEQVRATGIEPTYRDSMIRERITTKGRIREMEPATEMPALQMDPELIGVVTEHGPIRTWLAKRAEWDKKYASKLEKLRAEKTADRATAERTGFLTGDLHGENPPLAAVAGWHDVVSRADLPTECRLTLFIETSAKMLRSSRDTTEGGRDDHEPVCSLRFLICLTLIVLQVGVALCTARRRAAGKQELQVMPVLKTRRCNSPTSADTESDIL